MSGNSHQRRRSNRHWRHVYHIENARSYNATGIVIRDWCREQFGRKTFAQRWAIQTINEGRVYFVAFNRDKDAAWFSMNWVI